MNRNLIAIIAAVGVASLAACGTDPGPLAGTWKMAGLVQMTIHFRSGETEAMGVIEPVSYEVRGNDVFVTYMPGDSGYPELPTQDGDLLAVQEPRHKPELLVHLLTLLPRHRKSSSLCRKL